MDLGFLSCQTNADLLGNPTEPRLIHFRGLDEYLVVLIIDRSCKNQLEIRERFS
jgi:hypothetical protein